MELQIPSLPPLLSFFPKFGITSFDIFLLILVFKLIRNDPKNRCVKIYFECENFTKPDYDAEVYVISSDQTVRSEPVNQNLIVLKELVCGQV